VRVASALAIALAVERISGRVPAAGILGRRRWIRRDCDSARPSPGDGSLHDPLPAHDRHTSRSLSASLPDACPGPGPGPGPGAGLPRPIYPVDSKE